MEVAEALSSNTVAGSAATWSPPSRPDLISPGACIFPRKSPGFCGMGQRSATTIQPDAPQPSNTAFEYSFKHTECFITAFHFIFWHT